MAKSTEVKLPLVKDVSMGRMLHSAVLIKSIVFFIILIILIPNVVLYVEEDTKFETYLSTSFLMAGMILVSFILVNLIIKEYFVGSIVTDGIELQRNYSKYSAKRTKIYKLNSIKEFIFEKIEPGKQHILYFVDHSGNRHVIIDQFFMVIGNKEIDQFLSKLNESTGLPIKKIETNAN